jgi:tRNA(fMet)-specific endonuclease VapC
MESPVEEHYADIRNTLERAGTSIGPNDLLIAAHARSLGLTLVTDNMREFSRVPGLPVENWLEH